jgi:hypothetical protein
LHSAAEEFVSREAAKNTKEKIFAPSREKNLPSKPAQ